MRKDTLYLTLSRDITSYTITSGQRAIATNVNYAVTIESPTLTTNLAGRDVSLIISDTEGNTLTTATTFYPDTKNPYKAVTGSLLLDGEVYGKFFDGKPVDTAVRLPIVIRDKSATLLSSDIVVVNGGEVAEPSASDETVAGLVNAIRFYDLAEFKAWLDGVKERPDGLKPTDIVVGQWVHTQQDGSFICKELIGSEPSVTKNFTTIVTQFPLTGTLKMNPDNGVGLSVYSGDVYNDADATSFSVDAITYKGDSFTFTAGDNQIARQKDNYALENRVNSKMDETYAAMLPVRDATVGARNDAVSARNDAVAAMKDALGARDRAITAETNAGDARDNALTAKGQADDAAASASSSANFARTYKLEAEAARDASKGYADDAEKSATALANSVTAAESYANAASVSANAASASANAASGSANDASGYSNDAMDAALAASNSANAASDSEDLIKGYRDDAVSAARSANDSATDAAEKAALIPYVAQDASYALQSSRLLLGIDITDIETAIV